MSGLGYLVMIVMRFMRVYGYDGYEVMLVRMVMRLCW